MKNVLRGSSVACIAAAIAVFAFDAHAQTPKKKSPACASLKEEGKCKTRDDCRWIAAVMDTSGKKEKKGLLPRDAEGSDNLRMEQSRVTRTMPSWGSHEGYVIAILVPYTVAMSRRTRMTRIAIIGRADMNAE